MEINGMAIECNTLSDDLPDIRFSKVGTQVQAKLINTEDGHIELKVFANRKGLIIPKEKWQNAWSVDEDAILLQHQTNMTVTTRL